MADAKRRNAPDGPPFPRLAQARAKLLQPLTTELVRTELTLARQVPHLPTSQREERESALTVQRSGLQGAIERIQRACPSIAIVCQNGVPISDFHQRLLGGAGTVQITQQTDSKLLAVEIATGENTERLYLASVPIDLGGQTPQNSPWLPLVKSAQTLIIAFTKDLDLLQVGVSKALIESRRTDKSCRLVVFGAKEVPANLSSLPSEYSLDQPILVPLAGSEGSGNDPVRPLRAWLDEWLSKWLEAEFQGLAASFIRVAAPLSGGGARPAAPSGSAIGKYHRSRDQLAPVVTRTMPFSKASQRIQKLLVALNDEWSVEPMRTGWGQLSSQLKMDLTESRVAELVRALDNNVWAWGGRATNSDVELDTEAGRAAFARRVMEDGWAEIKRALIPSREQADGMRQRVQDALRRNAEWLSKQLPTEIPFLSADETWFGVELGQFPVEAPAAALEVALDAHFSRALQQEILGDYRSKGATSRTAGLGGVAGLVFVPLLLWASQAAACIQAGSAQSHSSTSLAVVDPISGIAVGVFVIVSVAGAALAKFFFGGTSPRQLPAPSSDSESDRKRQTAVLISREIIQSLKGLLGLAAAEFRADSAMGGSARGILGKVVEESLMRCAQNNLRCLLRAASVYASSASTDTGNQEDADILARLIPDQVRRDALRRHLDHLAVLERAEDALWTSSERETELLRKTAEVARTAWQSLTLPRLLSQSART